MSKRNLDNTDYMKQIKEQERPEREKKPQAFYSQKMEAYKDIERLLDKEGMNFLTIVLYIKRNYGFGRKIVSDHLKDLEEATGKRYFQKENK